MTEKYIIKNNSNLLLCSSHLFFINSIIGFIYELYDYSFLLFCVYLNSINYWRKPTYSLRRNIDITFAVVSFIYHNYSTIYVNFNDNVLKLTYIGILCYFFGVICHKYDKEFVSVIFHMFLHICINASVILYYV